MAKLSVKRSIVIKANASKVKAVVADFHNWPVWSPWLITEPEAEITTQADGKFYQWKGKRVGEGEMRVTNETDMQIDYDLTFLKPWKSKNTVQFLLKEQGEKTNVTWTMEGPWPFFLFWMKTKTEAFIGMDYERGLGMLKSYIEDGNVHSKLQFLGNQNYDGCNYVGIKTNCAFDAIGTHMENDYTTLFNWAKENNVEFSGVPFSIYHKFDMVKNKVSYTAAIPVNDTSKAKPNSIFVGSLPKLTLHTIRHTGPYDYVGNAWSASMMMLRAKEFKTNKKYPPMEFYQNDPTETPANELVSDICFAVK